MKCGISTACLYPMETGESLRLLLAGGHTHFEIFFNTFRELRPDYLARLREMLAQYGATVQSVHPFTCGYEGVLLFSDYESRFEDSLEFYRQYCAAAQALGARLLILHGMQRQFCTGALERRYFARYQALYEMARAYGVTVAQENVTRFCSEDPGFIRRMRQAAGERCAFCLDVKQAARSGVDCRAMIDAMGDRLVHIHLSDNRPDATCLLPGRGTADLFGLLAAARRNGFDGSVILEVYRTDFGDPAELAQCGGYVSNLVARLDPLAKNEEKMG